MFNTGVRETTLFVGLIIVGSMYLMGLMINIIKKVSTGKAKELEELLLIGNVNITREYQIYSREKDRSGD